jgi:hypothetical protein
VLANPETLSHCKDCLVNHTHMVHVVPWVTVSSVRIDVCSPWVALIFTLCPHFEL